MHFLSDPSFEHSFFKDIVRIDYSFDTQPMLINDYGYSYLMFCYGEFTAIDHKGSAVPVPHCLLKSTGDYFNITAKKNNIWITFEMPNHVLHNITGIPAFESRNKLYDLKDYVDSQLCDELYEKLRNVKDLNELSRITDSYLQPYYNTWQRPLVSTPIVDFIYQEKGLIKLSDLLEKVAFSERTLERLFKKEVGSTPYRFICLVRFNYVIREVEHNPDIKISTLVARYNYFDHSHFEKDFKKFLGQSVTNYKNEYNPLLTQALARKFIQEQEKSV